MVFPSQIYVANNKGLFLGHVATCTSKVNKSCVFGFINRHDIATVYKYLYEHGLNYRSEKLKSGNFCILPKPKNDIKNKRKNIKKQELTIDFVDSQQFTNLLSINNVNLAFIHNVNIDDNQGMILSTSAEIYNLYDNDTMIDFLNHMIKI